MCDDAECDYDMRVILKMRNMGMTWPGMIDHDDNGGNDDGKNYDTWVQRAASVREKFCSSQVVRNFV